MLTCSGCGYPFLVRAAARRDGDKVYCATCAPREDLTLLPGGYAEARQDYDAMKPRKPARRRAARKLALQLLITCVSLQTIPAAACDSLPHDIAPVGSCAHHT